jgi:hypothetical protein
MAVILLRFPPQLLQGVFSALGGAPPSAAGTRAAPQQQQQQVPVPHLLQSITDFLQQLNAVPASSSDAFDPMPVTSLAPGAAAAGSTAGGDSLRGACGLFVQCELLRVHMQCSSVGLQLHDVGEVVLLSGSRLLGCRSISVVAL